MGHYFFITDESDHYLGHYQPILARWWVLVMITKVMITLLVGTKKKWSSYKCISVAWMKSDGDHFVMAVMITSEVILPSLRSILDYTNLNWQTPNLFHKLTYYGDYLRLLTEKIWFLVKIVWFSLEIWLFSRRFLIFLPPRASKTCSFT